MIDKKQVEQVLSFYKIPCIVTDARNNAGFSDFVLSPSKGTTINKIQSRTNDLAIAFGCSVQVTIENLTLILRLKEETTPVYDFFSYSNNLNNKPGQLAFGINPTGRFIQYNLFDFPHLLVAGATGAGKSVFLHDAIISLMINNHVAFTLIDLKRVELSIYKGLNNVDIFTDAEQAEKRLLFEVSEMENRYKIMEKYSVRSYRDLPQDKALKARIIVIDELADLMLNRETRKSVENSVVRIAQLGRAAGIHLILATQRPSTNVITGLIKANIPCKLSFMCSSSIDARVIGCKGAENLTGKGDALLAVPGKKELERIQCFYISNDHLQTFINGVKSAQLANRGKTPTNPKQTPEKRRKTNIFNRLFR